MRAQHNLSLSADALLARRRFERAALDRLVRSRRRELRRIARRQMRRERVGHTLQTTALAHEAYLRHRQVHRIRIVVVVVGAKVRTGLDALSALE